VLYYFNFEGGGGDWMWCSCTVRSVTQVPKGPRSFYKDGDAALVWFDEVTSIEPPEPAHERAVELKRTKFNAEAGEGAWRLDLD
jgi:hypothetical protein